MFDLIVPYHFIFLNEATRKFEMTNVPLIAFLLDSAAPAFCV